MKKELTPIAEIEDSKSAANKIEPNSDGGNDESLSEPVVDFW